MTAHSNPNRAQPLQLSAPQTSAPPQQQQEQPPPSASQPEATPTPKEPPPQPKPAAAPPPVRSRRLADMAAEREAELRRKEAERTLKQQKTILHHAKIIRRCLQYATKVLDRYDVSI